MSINEAREKWHTMLGSDVHACKYVNDQSSCWAMLWPESNIVGYDESRRGKCLTGRIIYCNPGALCGPVVSLGIKCAADARCKLLHPQISAFSITTRRPRKKHEQKLRVDCAVTSPVHERPARITVYSV